jgi:predicted nucleotidyltransferase
MGKVHPRLDVTADELRAFCERWKIARLEIFGSVLRDDFDDQSDIDVLVTFEPDSVRSLHDELHIQEELAALLKRSVDLVERRLVEQSPNWIRRRSILSNARPLYAA